MSAAEATPPLVLSGVRIADFSRLLPGPWCTQMLADLGAEVIKIEQPGAGDFGRYNTPSYKRDGVYYNSVNRNKRSIALDLGRDDGREVAHRLIGWADVVVESFRVGVPKKLGIDYAAAKEINASVIYCSLTGFGQDGPLAPIPGHDLVIQAATGIMGVALDQEPVPPPPEFQTGDYAAAAMAAIGILAAIMRRQQTGEGCFLDLSLYDSVVAMSNIAMTGAMARLAGHTGEPKMELWGGNPRYNTYLTRDQRPIAVSLLEKKIWDEFCRLTGHEELIHEEEDWADRHTSHGDRAGLYRDAISKYCAEHTRDELIEKLTAIGVPVCPIYTPDEALASEHMAVRGLVEFVDHPAEGRIPQLVNPLAKAGLTDTRRRPAPGLGENGDDVLAELDYSEEERERLRETGVIGS